MEDMPGFEKCERLIMEMPSERSSYSFSKSPISTLQFTEPEGMKWEDFERLCCRLMARKYNLHCYRRYSSGRDQEGIDIYGYRSASPESLVVIQCKRYKEFDKTALRLAVNDFKKGLFFGKASEFLILTSVNLLSSSIEKELIKIRHELLAESCLFDIWNGERISEELKPYPEIVEAFYRQDVVQALCQPWGIRQRLLGILQKYEQDHGSLPADSGLLPEDEKEDLQHFLQNREVAFYNHGSLSKRMRIDDPFVSIDAFLPTSQEYPGSCLINIKQSSLKGCSIDLGHLEIINLFVQGANTAPLSGFRTFFVHSFESNGQKIFAVQMQGARLYLHEKSFLALCSAADTLAEAYSEALNEIERGWRAERFQVVRRDTVLVTLGHVPGWVWQKLLEYAAIHVSGSGDSEWHMFDAPSGWLKIYTRSKENVLNEGYHAFVSAPDFNGAQSPDGRVRLFWRPPSMNFEKLGERDYWPCDFTFDWLRNRLIPAVLKEIWQQKHPVSWRKTRQQQDAAEFEAWLEHNQIVDARLPNLSAIREQEGIPGLWYVASELQRRSTTIKLDRAIPGSVLYKLYGILRVLVSHANLTHWGYVASKLGIKGEDKSTIVSEIAEQAAKICAKDDAAWAVDGAMRAALEIISNGDVHLTGEEIRIFLECLAPIVEIYERVDFLNRHRLLPL
jgi:hypothetical protein